MPKFKSANFISELPTVTIEDGIVFTTVEKEGGLHTTCLTIGLYMRHHKNADKKLAEWHKQQSEKIAALKH